MAENKPIIHEKNYPVEASAGVDNAYYLHHCKTLERPVSYAACLSRLADIDAGRTNERTAECAKTLREGRCAAAGMREQERLHGSALFYFPRNINKPFLPVKVAGDFGVLITNLTDPALIPKAPSKAKTLPPITHRVPRDPLADSGSLADAINNAVAELNTTVNTIATPVDKEAAKGMLIDMAARGQLPVPPMVKPGEAQVIAVVAKPARPAMQPGETPLQYARRLAALKNPTT